MPSMSNNEFGAGIIGFLVGVLSGAGGLMLADWFREYRSRLKVHVDIAINPIVPPNPPNTITSTLGLGIRVDQGQFLQNAYVLCNNRKYSWLENDKFIDTKKLLVGENPSWFFPYIMTLEYIEDISGQQNVVSFRKKKDQSKHGVIITLRETTTKTPVFSTVLVMPNKGTALKQIINRKMIPLSVRILDDNVTRPLKFDGAIYLNRLNIGKLANGVPDLNTSEIEFTTQVPMSFLGSLSFG